MSLSPMKNAGFREGCHASLVRTSESNDNLEMVKGLAEIMAEATPPTGMNLQLEPVTMSLDAGACTAESVELHMDRPSVNVITNIVEMMNDIDVGGFKSDLFKRDLVTPVEEENLDDAAGDDCTSSAEGRRITCSSMQCNMNRAEVVCPSSAEERRTTCSSTPCKSDPWRIT